MRSILRGSIILVVALIGVGFTNEFFLRNAPREKVEIEETFVRKIKRNIASLYEPLLFERKVKEPDYRVTISSSNDSAFNQNRDVSNSPEDPVAEVSEGSGGYESLYETSGQRLSGGGVSSRASPVSQSKLRKENSKPQFGAGPSMFFSNQPLPKSSSASSPETNPQDTPPSSSGSSKSNDPLTCSASVGGGTFGHPIQVSLACSTVSDIKYCLQEGSCCDPENSGTAYTSPVVIGAENGNFCLSFFGETASLKVSTVATQSYNISNTYPDLQVSFSKIFYQTTELAGFHLLRSNDFSKSNHSIGEINLKSHDPGPSGLNMDCGEIVETYVTLSAPAPVAVFNPLDIASIPLGNQLNVPLPLSKLGYGDNFLTSYVVSNSFEAPLYSCSTNKVTLTDFEYFAPEISHGESGSNSAREFSASFVSYGFYELDASLNRTPAGTANQDDNGQELGLGSFGVFY